jgi:hypothetical protein
MDFRFLVVGGRSTSDGSAAQANTIFFFLVEPVSAAAYIAGATLPALPRRAMRPN